MSDPASDPADGDREEPRPKTPPPVTSGDGDASTSQDRFAGGTAVDNTAVTLSEQSDEKPYVGRSGFTGDASKGECSSKEGNSTPSGAGHPPGLTPQSSQEPTHLPIEAKTQDEGQLTLDKTGSSKATGSSATTIEERLAKLELKVGEQADELKGVQEELHDHKQYHEEVQLAAQKSLNKQQREIDSLKDDVHRLKQEKEELKQRLKELSEQLEKEKREKGKLKEMVEKLKSEKDEVQSMLAEKEKELKRKDRELQEARAQQARTQRELEDSKRACSDLQTDKDALKAQLEDQSSLSYKFYEAMRNINRTSQEVLGVRQQDGRVPQEPPPPYGDSMQGAPSSVEASQPDGPDLAMSVQGLVSHDQPPVGIHSLGLPEQHQDDDA